MKLAFIVQRCGKEIIGGAESLCLNLALKLSEYFEIEILTSCALDYMSWENYYPSGVEKINGITIRRFKTDFVRNVSKFNSISDMVLVGHHSLDDEELWMKMQGPHCSGLINFLKENKDNYDLFVFFTYLYATTYYGLPIVANKSILIPLAHDELPLKLSIYNKIFQNARGIIFHTEEEQKLIFNRFDIKKIKSKLIGYGVDELTDIPSGFSLKHDLAFPYLLYVGRIDESKGCDELISFFLKYNSENNSQLKLVLVGPKVFEFKKNENIVHLGVLDEKEKSYVIRKSLIFVMPSRYESFSIATMEAWLAKKPVLVNAKSEVLKAHCEKSNGGLYYETYEEFVECINLFLSSMSLLKQMGENGFDYVKHNYDWNNVINNYHNFIKELISKP
ncbi:MAG: glycosyltransferase family 4 protein [Thaumarchaeota archaeon]|nr:glycosyltransferase family 4 protein [Nitrososphaerota archaeon]